MVEQNGRRAKSHPAFEYGASRDTLVIHAAPPSCSPYGQVELQVYTRHKGLGSSESERELRTESFSFSGGRVRMAMRREFFRPCQPREAAIFNPLLR